jgi:aminoglycoside phosphotransferase (APT) family kinase protein
MAEDGPVIPTTIPHGRTARRLEWPHLPPHVRALVEERCGSPVTEARSQGAGYTPGFASVLTCEDGSRHFVKAASLKAQRMFAEAYRVEAVKLAGLPDAAPAPRLLWLHDADDWVVLGIEYVESRQPRRPWQEPDLAACVAMTEAMALALTPPPEGLVADDFATEFAGWPAYWDAVRCAGPDLPHFAERADEAAALAARFLEVTGGSTLVHTDIRDDNLMLATDGRVLLCDWNWPVVGAAWLDTVFLMIGPRGDGIDVDRVLAEAALTRDVPAEAVDIVLALVTGYFLMSADQPVPPTSPFVRDAQRWQGEVCWRWLAERRGWS